MKYSEFVEGCKQEKLHCANYVMNSADFENIADYSIAIPNLKDDLNITKPKSIKCLPRCRTQENDNQMSFAHYPQR